MLQLDSCILPLCLDFLLVRLINGMSSHLSDFGYLKSQQVHFMFLPPTFPVDFFQHVRMTDKFLQPTLQRAHYCFGLVYSPWRSYVQRLQEFQVILKSLLSKGVISPLEKALEQRSKLSSAFYSLIPLVYILNNKNRNNCNKH